MEGLIVKSNKGFYDVFIPEQQKIEVAKMRGVLRHRNIKPLVGDKVTLSLEGETLVIEKIAERKNQLVRPAIANIDMGIIVISGKEPDFQHYLLDKFLSVLTYNHIDPIIILSKVDLLEENQELDKIMAYYEKIGYPVFKAVMGQIENVSELRALVANKTTSVMGQTGVGKSTFLNALSGNKWEIETNEISQALGRGKHTTRIVQLYHFDDMWIADTPGFSSFEVDGFDARELSRTYIEFSEYPCKFQDCVHQNEIKCGVKVAVEEGAILQQRYQNYLKQLTELQQKVKQY